MRSLFATSLVLLLSACASNPVPPTGPEWLQNPPRALEAGKITFISMGEDRFGHRARELAEGAALADIVNECSLVPRGTQASMIHEMPEPQGSPHRVLAKTSVDEKLCGEAKRSASPENIRTLADKALTEKLQKYRDLIGESNEPVQKLAELAPIKNENELRLLRQRIGIQKQALILAEPGSPFEGKRFLGFLQSQINQVAAFEKAHPEELHSSKSWSSTQKKDAVALPDPVLSPTTESVATPSTSKPKVKNRVNFSPPSFPKKPEKNKTKKKKTR